MCPSMSLSISERPCRDAKQRVCNPVPNGTKPVSNYDYDVNTCSGLGGKSSEQAINLTFHSLLTSHAYMRTPISSQVLNSILPHTAGWWHSCSCRVHDTTQRIHGNLASLVDSTCTCHPGQRLQWPVGHAVHYAGGKGVTTEPNEQVDVAQKDDAH